MKYTFKKDIWDNTIIHSVQSENSTINNFGSWNWTPQKIQSLIDGVEQSKNKDSDESFDWQNEDVFFRSNKYGVFFVDLMKQRAGEKSKKQDLDLNHDEFIKFLQDFKKFVEENS